MAVDTMLEEEQEKLLALLAEAQRADRQRFRAIRSATAGTLAMHPRLPPDVETLNEGDLQILADEGFVRIFHDMRGGAFSFMVTPRGMQRSGRLTARRPERTGWERVDGTLERMQESLERAAHVDDLQIVGIRGREVLISVAQEVYNPDEQGEIDRTGSMDAWAKAVLKDFIKTSLAGGPNEQMRKVTTGAFQLAVALQHDRNADRMKARMCLEATRGVVQLFRILVDEKGR